MTIGKAHPDFAVGEHKQWEVALHAWRHESAMQGTRVTRNDENRFLADWLTRNNRSAEKTALCHYCVDEIASAMLEKQDPFKCPPDIKEKVRNFKMREIRW
jgi:hypothetical protein